MLRIYFFLVALLLTSMSCQGPSNEPVASSPVTGGTGEMAVPQEHQAAYNDLDSALDAFLASFPGTSGPSPVFASALLYANGNSGDQLLNPNVMTRVRQQLDGYQNMGIQGVVISIPVPILADDFPRSVEYLEFYKQVVLEVRQRGMDLLVEAGPIFAGTLYSPVKMDWSVYTKDSFLQARKDQLLTIANELKPDILQIANEPSTTTMLTGFQLTSEEYVDFIRSAVSQIDKSTGIQLSAGAGTWEALDYFDGLMDVEDLDFIDIHIYPLGRNATLLEKAMKISEKAISIGKRVIISEAWLYKVDSKDLGELGNDFEMIFSLDAFSFFEPLDEKFIRSMTLMARATGIEFVSFFWGRNFFAYLDYENYRGLSDRDINTAIVQASASAMESQNLSDLGEFFKAWIADH